MPAWHGGGQGGQPAGSSIGHIVVVHGGGHGLQTGTGVGVGVGVGDLCLWCLRWCVRAVEAGTGQTTIALVARWLSGFAELPDAAAVVTTPPASKRAPSAKPKSLVRIGTESTRVNRRPRR